MTTYYVTYLVHHSDVRRSQSFDSMLERALFIISITPYARIIKEWME